MSLFQKVLAYDQRSNALFFSSDDAARPLYAWFPAALGKQPAAFPNRVLVTRGNAARRDADLAGLVDRYSETFTLLISIADLPHIFRDALGAVVIKDQVMRLGFTFADAKACQITESRTLSGIAELTVKYLS